MDTENTAGLLLWGKMYLVEICSWVDNKWTGHQSVRYCMRMISSAAVNATIETTTAVPPSFRCMEEVAFGPSFPSGDHSTEVIIILCTCFERIGRG